MSVHAGDRVTLQTGTTHAVRERDDLDAWTLCGIIFRVDDSQLVRRHAWDPITCARCLR